MGNIRISKKYIKEEILTDLRENILFNILKDKKLGIMILKNVVIYILIIKKL